MNYNALQRLIFHTRMGLQEFLYKCGWRKPLDMELEDCREVEALTDQPFSINEAKDGDLPILDSRRTALYCGNGKLRECNFINAVIKRKNIIRAYRWMKERGFHTYIVDYATPFGWLALESLVDLRGMVERFDLYVYRGLVHQRRKSYRLIPETGIERVFTIAKADYRYDLYGNEFVKVILPHVGAICNWRGIRIARCFAVSEPLQKS